MRSLTSDSKHPEGSFCNYITDIDRKGIPMTVTNVRIKEGYILREFGGEFNIFHEKDEAGAVVTMNSINELGCFLWSGLKKKESFQELIHAVMIRNDMEKDEAQMEVEEFLAKLMNAGIVEIEE